MAHPNNKKAATPAATPAPASTPAPAPVHPAIAALKAANVVNVALRATGKYAALPPAQMLGKKVVCNLVVTLACGTVLVVAQACATTSVNMHTCGNGGTHTATATPNGLAIATTGATPAPAPVHTAFANAVLACGGQYATPTGRATANATPAPNTAGLRLYVPLGTLLAVLAAGGLANANVAATMPGAWLAQGKGGAMVPPTG